MNELLLFMKRALKVQLSYQSLAVLLQNETKIFRAHHPQTKRDKPSAKTSSINFK